MTTVLSRITLGLVSLLLLAGFVAADSEFVYYNNGGGEITIFGYQGTPAGRLVIPEMIDGLTVTEIGESAFSNAWGAFDMLTGVEIPDTVVRIGSGAFFLCHGLTNIDLPSNLTQLDSGAFSFTGLADIFIPQHVTLNGSSAFSDCRNLTAITVHRRNPSYSSIDGVLFDRSKTTLIRHPEARSGEFVIPTGVSTIESGAFASSTSLTSVTIPSGVTTIGSAAFSSCSRLTTAVIPASVTNIGNGAFGGCLGLATINVDPANTAYSSVDGVLLNSDQSTLIQCPAGRTGGFAIPPGCTVISDNAFAACAALDSVTVPAGVSTIGTRAFENCLTLASIDIPSSVTTIGESAFSGCVELAQVLLSPGITTIDSYTFSRCVRIANLVIPDTVTSIQNDAFSYCSSLLEVVIPPGVTTIGNTAFTGCTSLAGVTLPDGFTTFGTGAFSHCSSLSSISFPESVTTIGYSAFSSCGSLTSIFIPSGVTSIGPSPFRNCDQLMEILVDATNPLFSSHDGILFNKTLTKLIQFPPGRMGEFEIPASVAVIDDSAFASCRLLTRVTMGGNVTSIGINAFSSCSGLSRMLIGVGITNIESFAFNGCDNLEAIDVEPANPSFSSLGGVLYNQAQTTLIQCPGGLAGSVTIPASVTTIQTNAFSYSSNLTAIHVDAANSTLSSADGILFNNSKSNLICCPRGKSGVVQIPADVTRIFNSAFGGCGLLTAFSVDPANPEFASLDGLLYDKSLTELIKCPPEKSGVISLSAMVTRISDRALSLCKHVTAIEVDTANPVFTSVDGVLFNKSLSMLIQYPGEKSGYAIIPASVISLGRGAFDYRNDLAGLVFLGNMPTTIYVSFDASVPLQYFYGAIGYGSSFWGSWTVLNMGPESPVKIWLLENAYPYDTNVTSDIGGNGGSLLMAYALNLNPRSNLTSSMPLPELDGELLTITFYAASEGITYQVETTGDLATWTTDGVSISPPNSGGFRTASVPATDTARFIRLVVRE